MTMLRPCRSHKIYMCEACKELGTVGSHLRSVTREDDEANEGDTNSRRDVFSEPGWGMPDAALEDLAQAFSQALPGQAAYLRRVREARRQGQNVPE